MVALIPKGWGQLVLAVLGGGILALINAPFSFAPALFFGIPLLFLLHKNAPTRRRAAAIGWFAGLGYFGLTFVWIVEPFMVDAARHAWIAPFALIAMAGGFALYWSVAFGFAMRGGCLSFAACWACAELIRAYLFTGFPWAMIGYGWLETPVAQVASIVGPHGLTFLTILAIVLMADLLTHNYRNARLGIALVLGLLISGLALDQRSVPSREDPVIVRLVQPNAAQSLKWLPEFAEVFFERQLELSASPANILPDVTIWPETAVAFIAQERPDLVTRMIDSGNGASLIFGSRLRDENGNWYNGMHILDPNGYVIDTYAKHHLVPFGEFVPLPWLLKLVGLSAMTGTGWTPGEGKRIIEPLDIPAFLVMICYETIFPQNAMIFGERPEWLVQITNDAWYGKFSGPYQHLDLARQRAIEQGLPLARAANTGVSAMIDPKGNVVDSLDLNRTGYIDTELPGAFATTIYARTGDLPIIFIFFLLFLGKTLKKLRRNKY